MEEQIRQILKAIGEDPDREDSSERRSGSPNRCPF